MTVISSGINSFLALESVSLGIQFCFCQCVSVDKHTGLLKPVSSSVKGDGSHYTLSMCYMHKTLLTTLRVLTHFILMATL